MGRFILEKSDTNVYISTDTENGVSIRFIEHQFDNTQVTIQENKSLSIEDLAKIKREMEIFLLKNYYDIVMPEGVHEIKKMGDVFYIRRLKYPEFEIKITDEIDAHKLAQNLRKCAAWLDSPQNKKRES